MIRSKIFISDCVVFFDTIATFVQTIAGWIISATKNIAQISNGISNPVVAGIIYWLIRILICGGCLVGAGILVAFIGIKIAELYKKCCWDMITIMVILISMATAIYFGKWIKTTLPINLLFLLLFVQLVYVGIRWYVKGWREQGISLKQNTDILLVLYVFTFALIYIIILARRRKHMTQFEKLDLLLRECGGTIQTFQVLNNGISKSVFMHM